jgi:hypothetical protein
MSFASELIHFQLSTEFRKIVKLEGSTMKEVMIPAPITDWSWSCVGHIYETCQ